jgi:uncharacterized protein (UPF0371 family)
MEKIGFDTDKYLEAQSKAITERVGKFEKLYLEFGGKLCLDTHAARVLPGYRPTAKIELLKQLGDIEIICCISAKHLESGKKRGDSGLTYDYQTLKDINDIKDAGLEVSSVVITRYQGEASADKFKRKLENYGFKVYLHKEIIGYPNDIDKVLQGYESQPMVGTNKKLIIVTGAGGNSGKMATCLTQVYNERRNGTNTGYAKFETFPIWNLDLNHPVNIAYEAATADLLDVNMIDPFHQKAYNITSVNYNRDIENFDILISLMKKITGEENPFGYKSPTDMGVNTAAKGIIEDDICKEAAKEEIVRRYFKYFREKVEGNEVQSTIDRMQEIMEKVDVKESDRLVVEPARLAAKEAEGKEGKGNQGIFCGAAVQLSTGQIVTGKNSSLLHAESAAILNAIKVLANISDEILLLPTNVINEINYLKTKILGERTESLNLEEVLIALSVSTSINPMVQVCIETLKELKGCEFHCTHLPSRGDEAGLRKLGLNITTDAKPSIRL